MSNDSVVYTVEVLDAALCYTFEELCDISRRSDTFVSKLVDYEIIVADGPTEADFTYTQLQRLLKASRLQRDFEINTSAIALVIDLLDTKQKLEQKIKRLERYKNKPSH